jgi:tetratricopeptide (TPR) repeat protein
VRRALAALLVVTAAASCLAYTESATASATKRVLALTGAAIVLAVSLTSSATPRLGWRPGWIAALGFVSWSALSSLWGAEGAVLGLGVLVAAAAFGSVSASLGSERARAIAMRVGLVVGVALASFVLAAWAFGERGFSLHAGQGNPNWAGLVLAVALPLALADSPWTAAPQSRRRALRFATGAVMTLAIAATASRTAIAAAFAAVTVLALAGARRDRWRALSIVLVAAAVAGAVTLGTNATGGAQATRATDTGRALEGRLWIHGITLRAALDHLPWGAGLGRFHETFLTEQGRALSQLSPGNAALAFQNATTAHQDFLEVTLESGLVALLLLIAALVIAFRLHWRFEFAAGAGTLAAFAVAALADSPLRETPVAILIGLVLAALPGTAPRDPPSGGRRAWLLRLGLLACAGMLLPNALLAFIASRARTAALEATPERRLELLQRATRLDPTHAGTALELGTARLELGDVEGAVRDLRRAERLDGDPASAAALGNALVARNELGAARAAYERAVTLNPGSFRARIGLAEALRRLGVFADAETHAAVAVALLPGDARARELLDRIREQRTDATLGVTAPAND